MSTSELIDTFIKHVETYLDYAQLEIIEASVAESMAKKSEYDPSFGNRLVDLQHERNRHRAELLRHGWILARMLETSGHDALPLIGILNRADRGGGGPERVDPLWVDVKSQLQHIKLRQERESASGTSKARSRHQEKAAWLGRALILRRDHPDWSDARIAREVGIDKSQLSRSPEYQRAAALARGNKSDLPKGHVETNSKTGERTLEAYQDADDSEAEE